LDDELIRVNTGKINCYGFTCRKVGIAEATPGGCSFYK